MAQTLTQQARRAAEAVLKLEEMIYRIEVSQGRYDHKHQQNENAVIVQAQKPEQLPSTPDESGEVDEPGGRLGLSQRRSARAGDR